MENVGHDSFLHIKQFFELSRQSESIKKTIRALSSFPPGIQDFYLFSEETFGSSLALSFASSLVCMSTSEVGNTRDRPVVVFCRKRSLDAQPPASIQSFINTSEDSSSALLSSGVSLSSPQLRPNCSPSSCLLPSSLEGVHFKYVANGIRDVIDYLSCLHLLPTNQLPHGFVVLDISDLRRDDARGGLAATLALLSDAASFVRRRLSDQSLKPSSDAVLDPVIERSGPKESLDRSLGSTSDTSSINRLCICPLLVVDSTSEMVRPIYIVRHWFPIMLVCQSVSKGCEAIESKQVAHESGLRVLSILSSSTDFHKLNSDLVGKEIVFKENLKGLEVVQIRNS